jgi:hypothetical protein
VAKSVPVSREPASIPPPPPPSKLHGLPFKSKPDSGFPSEEGQPHKEKNPSMYDVLRKKENQVRSVDPGRAPSRMSVMDLKGAAAIDRFESFMSDTSALNPLYDTAVVVLRGKKCEACDSEVKRISEIVQTDPDYKGPTFLFVDADAAPAFLKRPPFKGAKDAPNDKHSAFFVFERRGNESFSFVEEKPVSRTDTLEWALGFRSISPLR